MGKPPRRDLRALLDVPQGDLRATLDHRLGRLGFPALRPAQVDLLGLISAKEGPGGDGVGPAGVRLPELVAALQLPKQTVGDMVDDLEALRLVERVADPSHGVIKRVRLGAKGRLWAAEVKRCAVTTEARWAVKLGRAKMRSLRGLLEELATTVEAVAESPAQSPTRRRR